MRHREFGQLRQRGADAALVLLATAVAVAAFLTVLPSRGVPDDRLPAATVEGSAGPTPIPATVSRAVALLDEGDRQWTLGVVGDATGDEAQEWVHLLAERLSGQKDRPTIVHDWSTESNSYTSVTTIGAGGGAPIVIWNGSGGGVGPEYSVRNFDRLFPEKPDVLVFNHGNEILQAGTVDAAMASQVRASWSTWGRGAVAHAAVMQNPRSDDFAQRQEDVVARVRQWAQALDVERVDVFAAYRGSDVGRLLDADGVRPDAEGQRLWARVAAQTLFP